MLLKTLRKQRFTLIEVFICLALLLTLTSTFAYLGYDTVKEFRKRNGRASFRDYLLFLHHENALVENNLMVLLVQKGETIEVSLGGNTKGLNIKTKQRNFYVGNLFKDGEIYALKITPQAFPSDAYLTTWIAKNDCTYQFYID